MTTGLERQASLKGFAVGVTDVGRVRQENQDTFFINEPLGIYAVMDGAGGMHDGARASALVREALTDISAPVDAEDLFDQFEAHVVMAKKQIEAETERAGGAMMGTTIAAILTHGTHFVCLWAGDSRAYRFRDGQLEQLTTDHTEAQDLIDKGVLTAEEARSYPRRHVITRAIGSGLDLELDAVSGNLRPSDRFLLCSDGLTGHLDDTVIETMLRNGAAGSTARALVDGALDRGGTDNVTVVIVDIDHRAAAVAEAGS